MFEITKKYITRQLYTDKVKPFINQPLIKVFTGQRRIGKSYILYQISDIIKKMHADANIIFVDKELLEFSHIKTEIDLYQFVKQSINKEVNNYLFVDEIQEISNFQLCLRTLLNENTCDIYCSGSNAKMLSGDLATSLSGRYIEINVHSLSYSEFLNFYSLDDSNESLQHYFRFGGMPFLHNLPQDESVAYEYLKSVYSTILLKDVVSRENIRNVAFLENLVAYLIDNTGSIFSALNINKYLKSQQINMPVQTVINYLKSLCNSYFIYKVQRSDIHGMKIFEQNEKYYFEDLGIRNAISHYDLKNDVSKLMENVIYIELLRRGYRVYVGKDHEKEIDFVAIKDDKKIYIQSTYLMMDSATVKREFDNLLQIPNNHPKYVITLDEWNKNGNYQGIKQIHLRDFLLDKQ